MLISGQGLLKFGQVKTNKDNERATDTAAVNSDKAEQKRTFQQKWELSHHWLRFDGTSMFCTLCENAGCKNSFTSGCNNFRSSALTEHVEGKDHKGAVHVPTEQENKKVMEEKLLSGQKRTILVKIKVLNWMVDRGVPLPCFDFESLLDLLAELNTPDVFQ